MKNYLYIALFCLIMTAGACKNKTGGQTTASSELSDDALMDTVQRRTFLYFWEGAESQQGACARTVSCRRGISAKRRQCSYFGRQWFRYYGYSCRNRPWLRHPRRRSGTNGTYRFLPRKSRPLSRSISALVVWRYGKGETFRSER